MPDMFEELELAIGPLAQDGRRERLGDLLDGDGRVGELVLRRAKDRGKGWRERTIDR